jgi:hypothetical protein
MVFAHGTTFRKNIGFTYSQIYKRPSGHQVSSFHWHSNQVWPVVGRNDLQYTNCCSFSLLADHGCWLHPESDMVSNHFAGMVKWYCDKLWAWGFSGSLLKDSSPLLLSIAHLLDPWQSKRPPGNPPLQWNYLLLISTPLTVDFPIAKHVYVLLSNCLLDGPSQKNIAW